MTRLAFLTGSLALAVTALGVGLFGRKARPPEPGSPATTAGQPLGLLLLLTKAS